MDEKDKNSISKTQEAFDKFFNELYAIPTSAKSKSEKIEELKKFKNRNPDLPGNLTDVFELVENAINNDSLKTKNDVKDFEKKFNQMKAEKKEQIENTEYDTNQQAVHNATISEIEEETGLSKVTINEALSPDADKIVQINEEMGDNADKVDNGPYKLKRPDVEKVRKLYNYKVEGKITSGIGDLDKFLGFIQPVINQLIITAWKPVFWALDAKDAAFESVENWKNKKKDLEVAWKTLQSMGAVAKDKPFSWSQNVEEQENEIAGYFNAFMCDKMNDEISKKNKAIDKELEMEKQAKISQYIKDGKDPKVAEDMAQKEIDEYKKLDEYKKENNDRTDLFDDTKNPKQSRYTIDDEFLKLLRKDGSRDDKGKLTDNGKKLMKGYSVILDLFNKKDSDTFVDRYVCDMSDLMKEANIGKGDYSIRKKFDVDKIEDVKTEDYIKYQDGELSTKEKNEDILKALSGMIENKTK